MSISADYQQEAQETVLTAAVEDVADGRVFSPEMEQALKECVLSEASSLDVWRPIWEYVENMADDVEAEFDEGY